MAFMIGNGEHFSEIEKIDSERTSWNLKAKILRLWEVSDFSRPNSPFSLEMVLMDSEGGRIHATVKKTLIYKFKDDLSEGKRITNHDVKGSLFHLVPISDVVSGSYDTDYLVDVIGVLTGVGTEREVTSQNGSTTKLNVIALEAQGFNALYLVRMLMN
ncbi:unnamed protein product [Trifolium pratense]|uniref:Uncharacterized protein n=1 Tax=Trifolium pratense TaxID=57577 RepID=A0ACB0IYX4_TRIPR|nr:unnamed protein product [Trifolium pratense]